MDQYIGTMLDNRYELMEIIGVGGTAVVLNTAVVGEGTADDWLTAMQHNIDQIQKATGVSP